MSLIRILNWNTQIASPNGRTHRFKTIQQIIATYNADVICLTEAYPETISMDGHVITSGLSDWGNYEDKGARKVVLWSKFGWRDVDPLGDERLPEGRFVSGTTTIHNIDLRFVGMCIPYHGYRSTERWGERHKKVWQGACEYLDVLRESILTRPQFQAHTILLGDFNLQIPPRGYPGKNSVVNALREQTFSDWHIPTSGELDDPAMDKPFIDHIALTQDFRIENMDFISRFTESGATLSDHNGVTMDVRCE